MLAWHAVRIYHWPGFEKQRQRNAGRVPVSSVRSCCAPARPPLQDRTAEDENGNFWRRSCHQSVCGSRRGGSSQAPRRLESHFFFLLIYILERKAKRRLQLIISLSFAIQWIFTARQIPSQGCTVSSSTRVSLSEKNMGKTLMIKNK